MDGLIIDSEPLWRKAEISVFNSMGFEFSDEMCIQTMGMRIDAVIEHWHNKFKWENPSIGEVVNNIQNQVIELVRDYGKPLDGVKETVDELIINKIPIAIASSSSKKIINAVVEKLNLNDKFDVLHSAEDEHFGKPSPDVFLSTAKMLKMENNKCIVLEDSNFGMQAAINAGMKVIVVPEKGTLPNWTKKANLTLQSLENFSINSLFEL